MRIYFDLGLFGLAASIVSGNGEGCLAFSGLMFYLWLCRKVVYLKGLIR